MNGWIHTGRANIYLITNKTTGKSYVGCTVLPIDLRWKSHIAYAKFKPDRHLYKDLLKYGPQDFEISSLQWCKTKNSSHQFKREKFWIHKLKTQFPNGYNSENLHKKRENGIRRNTKTEVGSRDSEG